MVRTYSWRRAALALTALTPWTLCRVADLRTVRGHNAAAKDHVNNAIPSLRQSWLQQSPLAGASVTGWRESAYYSAEYASVWGSHLGAPAESLLTGLGITLAHRKQL